MLLAFAIVMFLWHSAAKSLVATYGWPIGIPILALMFGYALMVDRRERARRARELRPD